MKTIPILALLAVALALPGRAADPKPADKTKPADKPAAKPAPKPVEVGIRMIDGLRFDPPRFEVAPGADVVVKLHNDDSTHQIHNWLLLEPGKRETIVQAALELGDKAEQMAHVPDTPLVLAHSGLLGPEAKDKVSFRAPTTPGVYPYVCTFPGHGFVMYGAMYVGVKPPPLGKDTHLPPSASGEAVAGGGKRPFIQRMFMPNASPAAIAVALPNKLNACYDASLCRVRYTWSGDFLDASQYWKSNGRNLAELLGPVVWTAPREFTVLGDAKTSPAFHGYRLESGLPVFLWEKDGARVEEAWRESGADLQLHFVIKAGERPVTFHGVGLPGAKPVEIAAKTEHRAVVTLTSTFSATPAATGTP